MLARRSSASGPSRSGWEAAFARRPPPRPPFPRRPLYASVRAPAFVRRPLGVQPPRAGLRTRAFVGRFPRAGHRVLGPQCCDRRDPVSAGRRPGGSAV